MSSNLFNARLDIISYDYISDNEWSIEARVIDNTGNFIANNAQVGNIIYINDSINSGILRYRVTSISRASGSKFNANIIWDDENEFPMEPLAGYEAVIGASSENLRLASLTSGSDNNVGESFINAIKNYENFKIIDKLSGSGGGIKKSYIANEDIEAYKIVYITNGINISIADSYNVDCADRIIGISLESAKTGELIDVQIGSKVYNKNWNFSETGKTIFIDKNGEFSTSPDSNAAFIQQLGLIVSSDTIDLDMEEAIII